MARALATCLALAALTASASGRSLAAAPAAAAAPARAAALTAPGAAFARSDPQVAAAISGQGVPDTAPLAQTGVEVPLAGRPVGEKRTVDQVNAAAPAFALPTKDGVVEAKPSLTVSNSGGGPAAGLAGAAAGAAAGAGAGADGGRAAPAPAAAAAARAQAELPGDPAVPVAPSYLAPTNPAYKAGADSPELASLVAAAKAAEAPAKALAAARAAEVGGTAKPVVPKWEGEDGAAAKPAPATAAATATPPSLPSTAAAAAADNGGVLPKRNPAPNAPDGGRAEGEGGTAAAGTVKAAGIDNPTGQVVGGSIGGTTLNALVGVRVATPFFGTGFNLCVDRYFGSFPKVGIVIPNPIAWLLPEIMELGDGLRATIDLPVGGKTAPAGAKVSANSDGFVIWLPSIQPTMLGEFGFRYGLQVAQLFGVDFGFGLLKSTCTIDFVRV